MASSTSSSSPLSEAYGVSCRACGSPRSLDEPCPACGSPAADAEERRRLLTHRDRLRRLHQRIRAIAAIGLMHRDPDTGLGQSSWLTRAMGCTFVVLFFFAGLVALPQAASAQQHVHLDELGLAFEMPGDWQENQRDYWLPQMAHYSARSADERQVFAIEYYGALDAASLATLQDVYIQLRLPAGATPERLPPEALPAPFSSGARLQTDACTAYVYAATVGGKGYVVSYISTGQRHAEATFAQIVASLHFEEGR